MEGVISERAIKFNKRFLNEIKERAGCTTGTAGQRQSCEYQSIRDGQSQIAQCCLSV